MGYAIRSAGQVMHEVFKSFDCYENLEVSSVYLDMYKALDKV